MASRMDGKTVQGARSGGMTAHIQGPHLIPNVGREAMLNAEVVRRRPKAKPKPAPPPQPKAKAVEGKRKKKQRRYRSRSRSHGRAPEDVAHEEEDEEAEEASDEEEQQREELMSTWDPEKEGMSVAEAREREGKRLEEERRQLRELKEAQEKKRKQEADRKKKLSNIFALSADDFDKEEEEQAKRAQASKEEDQRLARPLMQSMSVQRSASAAPASQPRRDNALLDESAPGSGFDKCWKNWDFAKVEDPSEVARQFMRVTAAKRRGYGGGGTGGRKSPTRRPGSSSRSPSRPRR